MCIAYMHACACVCVAKCYCTRKGKTYTKPMELWRTGKRPKDLRRHLREYIWMQFCLLWLLTLCVCVWGGVFLYRVDFLKHSL